MNRRIAGSLALETANDCLRKQKDGLRSNGGGRLVEVSGGSATAVLTFAVRLLLEAQRAGEPVAWITGGDSFYPPDVHDAGVDLEALVVVRLPRARGKETQPARAADHLLRSGAFGLVVLDLGNASRDRALPLPIQSRLAGLAKKHGSALVVLTARDDSMRSLGPLVSLHLEATRRASGCAFRVLKSKLPGDGEARTGGGAFSRAALEAGGIYRAPDGLR